MAGRNGTLPGVVTRVLADPVRMYLPAQYWNRARDWFGMPMDYNLLLAGAVQIGTFTVPNVADLLVLALWAHVTTLASALVEQPEQHVLISIQDSGSGGNWFGAADGAVGTAGYAHLMNIAGSKQRSVASSTSDGGLKHPRFCPAGANVQVALANLDPANARRVFLQFEGVQIYRSLRQGE